MRLNYHYLNYFSFNISSIWCEIDSLLTLIHSKIKLYLEYFWGLIIIKGRYMILTPGYCLFCETKWSISGAYGNRLFHFILNLTIAITNWIYFDSKTLNRSVVCNGLFISLHGSQQELVCLIVDCYRSGVLDLAVYNHWKLIRS